jgi:thiamine biosynthesis lipoprotein
MKKRIISLSMILGMLALGAGCSGRQEVLIQGNTMGTTYHIKVVTDRQHNADGLPEKIEARLKEINQSMSVFIPDSDISRFNRLDKVGEKIKISEDFYRVMSVAARLYRWTQGAWDGTVMPLVNLWGFGPRHMQTEPPSPEAIQAAKQKVGFDRIVIGQDRTLEKRRADVTLDLASIAKGFGVDAISRLVRESGFSNFIVEIGGEVFASGVRVDGKPWRVGINRPDENASPTAIYRALSLTDKALATSGDYRNFFEKNGVRYSHIIDPATGYPVSNGVVSTSVIADTCTEADGLATALMVMGPERGLALVNRLPGVECLIVVHGKDGSLINYPSKGFNMGRK